LRRCSGGAKKTPAIAGAFPGIEKYLQFRGGSTFFFVVVVRVVYVIFWTTG
jgi:hypothetical protein